MFPINIVSCVHEKMYLHTYTQIITDICLYTVIYIYICMYIYIYIYVCVYVYTHIYIYIQYICIQLYTSVCVCVCVCHIICNYLHVYSIVLPHFQRDHATSSPCHGTKSSLGHIDVPCTSHMFSTVRSSASENLLSPASLNLSTTCCVECLEILAPFLTCFQCPEEYGMKSGQIMKAHNDP